MVIRSTRHPEAAPELGLQPAQWGEQPLVEMGEVPLDALCCPVIRPLEDALQLEAKEASEAWLSCLAPGWLPESSKLEESVGLDS